VRSGQLALQTGIRNNALKTARRTSNFLKNYSAEERARDRATVKNKNASKAARKAARARLNRLGSSPETRTNALTTAASAESEIATLKGGSEASVDLATAMKELAEAIKEQNQLQSSVQATSSREALRMLSDVISGQIVGKRTSVTQPLGVRY
jgi:alpha-beta hydrolase superfamily lysophospholipase